MFQNKVIALNVDGDLLTKLAELLGGEVAGQVKEALASQGIVVPEAPKAVEPEKAKPATIHKAMRYSLFAGGKRLRPAVCLAAAQACGARYAIFTATHFNGFMQWQSDLYPYGLKQTRWRGGRGDVVADFVASCRQAGITPGL